MYLKVEVDGKAKLYFLENIKSVVLGSGSKAQLKIDSNEVDELHARVTEVDGDFFVEDLGSKSGTFINEQALVPNAKEPFNSFFPVQLGQNVFLRLLDESTAAALMAQRKKANSGAPKKDLITPPPASEKPPQPSARKGAPSPPRSSNQAASRPTALPSGQRKARKKIAVQSPTKAAPKKSSGNLAFVFAAVVLGIGAYLYTSWREQLISEPAAEIIAAAQESERAAQAASEAREPEERGFSAQNAQDAIAMDKCLSDLEASLCSSFKDVRRTSYHEGFMALGNRLFFIVDLRRMQNEYSSVRYTPEEEEKLFQEMLSYLGTRGAEEARANDYLAPASFLRKELVAQAALWTDLRLSQTIAPVLEQDEREEFYVIAYYGDPSEYRGHAKVERAALEAALKASDELNWNLKTFWRSNFGQQLQAGLQGVPPVDFNLDFPEFFASAERPSEAETQAPTPNEQSELPGEVDEPELDQESDFRESSETL